MVILIILYYVYIEERNNYEKLNDEYNNLFDYIQNFENWIDDEQMYRHELKNNLSSIRGMTKEQKVKQKIDEMLKISIQVDEHYVEQLKYVPKGGLKGILYYKIAIAKNAKVRMITELSEKVTERLNELENDEIRCLSILIGIYLDNAIEAASVSKKKTVTLEMYMVEENLRIVISNSYKEKVPLKEMTAKGFTTKGEGRGRGLHYAEKVINKRKNFSAEKRFLNDYFIEQVTITPSYKSKKKG